MTNEATILAVDDTPDSLALLAEILTAAGYQVRPADNGEMALAAVTANPPDLILLDVRMKGVDGFEVCRRLKAREETRHIPIILISAFADAKEMMAGLQLGAADYISKPFQAEELLIRVKTHLALSRANVSLEQQTAALRQTNEQLQSEIVKRQRMEDELRQSLDQAEHSRQTMLGTLEDQKRAEKALRESEIRFRTLVETAPEAIFIQTNSRFAYVNAAALGLFGATRPEELLGQPVLDRFHPDFRTQVRERIRLLNEERQPAPTLDEVYLKLDGSPVDVSVCAIPFSYQNQAGALVFVRDITERKRAAEALRGSETQLHAILESTDDGILAVDSSGKKVIKANRRFAELWRVPQSIIDAGDNRALRNFVLKQLSDPDAFLKKLQSLYGTDAVVMDTLTFKDGRIFERYGSPMLMDGVLTGRVWSFRDITERKRAEEALHESEARYHTLFDKSADGILIADIETKTFKYANPALCQMLGYAEDELRTMGVPDIHPKDAVQSVVAEFEAQVRGDKILVTDIPCLRKDGSVVHVDINSFKITVDGRPCNVGFFRDITERKKANVVQSRLVAIMEASPDFVGYADAKDGQILYINQSGRKMVGIGEHEDLNGIKIPNVHPEWMNLKLREELMPAASRDGFWSGEGAFRHRDGREIPIWIVLQAHRSPGGAVEIFSTVSRDITERKQAEQRVTDALNFNQTMLHASPVGIIVFKAAGPCISANEAIVQIVGGSREEVLKQNFRQLESWKNSGMLAAAEAALATQTERKLETQSFTTFGRKVWCFCRFVPFQYEGELHLLLLMSDITERKRADEEVVRTAREWQSTFDATNDAIWILDQNNRILRTNKTAETYFQRPCSEMMGKPCWEIVHGTTEPILDCPFVRSRKSGHRETMDLQIGERWFEVIVDPILDAAGQYAGAVHIVSDITARKRAEEVLANERALLRTLVDHLPMAVYLKDLAGRKTLANLVELDYVGATSEAEVIGKTDFDLYPPEQAAGYQAINQEIIRTGQPEINRESSFTKPDGSVIHLLGSVVPVRDIAGRVTGLAGINLDITERKRAEEALRKSRALYYSFVEQLPIGIFRKDREGRFILVNPEFCRFKVMKAEEFLGKTPREVAAVEAAKQGAMGLATKYAASGAEHHEQIMQTGKPIDLVEEYIYADGRKQFLHVIKLPVVDPDGKIIGTQGIQFDITELKQAEERIREQAALLDAANDTIYVRTLDHTVTYWNDGAERLYGWTRAEALGHKIIELGEVDREAFETAHAVLLEQGSWSGELKKTSKAGKEFTVFCRWTLLRDEQNRPKEVLAINTDITEQKQLETNFLRAQRMEGIGALAGGIAHDLNNILQPILMTAPLLRETTSDPESREMLDTVENCAQRGADIIKQLLTFARGKPSARVPLPVRHLLNEMSKLIHETFPKNIQLRVNVPKDLWLVLGDATQIHQALMNLCVNARDAMPNGGTLTLTAGNLTLDEAFAAMMPSAKPGPHICVSVADTGMGIPSEHLDRIFDPFFTTKEIGKGTGLGLATVLGIVRGHGGFVRVNSQAGKGTIFELYLPASSETKAAARSKPETLPPRADGELILVVDDEADVRGVVRRTLEKHGYRVVTAAEGAEAMGLFAQHRAEVRAVLTDMMMPDMDGPSLVRTLRHLEPQLPILGMTGVGEKADIKGLETLDLLVLLTKPFNIAVLLDILHQSLAAPRKAKGKS